MRFFSIIVRRLWIDHVEGIENLPASGPAVIASNHESYFDFICFLAVSPRPVIYMAGEVFFKKWWWRPLVKATGQIRVDRNQGDKTAAINSAIEVLKRGELFGIFPEGTRSATGRLQQAFTGVAKIAFSARSNVIPVGIIGTYEIMSRHDKIPRFKKCVIKIGRSISLESYLSGRVKNDGDLYRFVTDKVIMKEISNLTGEEYNF